MDFRICSVPRHIGSSPDILIRMVVDQIPPIAFPHFPFYSRLSQTLVVSLSPVFDSLRQLVLGPTVVLSLVC